MTPEQPCVRDLTKGEIKEIISILKVSIISDDNKAEYYTKLLQKSLSLPEVLKYIRLEDDEETITNNLIQAVFPTTMKIMLLMLTEQIRRHFPVNFLKRFGRQVQRQMKLNGTRLQKKALIKNCF